MISESAKSSLQQYRQQAETHEIHFVDSQDTSIGVLALRVGCARETNALVDIFSSTDGSGLDTCSSWLADLLVKLKTGGDVVGVAVILGENDVKSSGIFDSLDSTPGQDN